MYSVDFLLDMRPLKGYGTDTKEKELCKDKSPTPNTNGLMSRGPELAPVSKKMVENGNEKEKNKKFYATGNGDGQALAARSGCLSRIRVERKKEAKYSVQAQTGPRLHTDRHAVASLHQLFLIESTNTCTHMQVYRIQAHIPHVDMSSKRLRTCRHSITNSQPRHKKKSSKNIVQKKKRTSLPPAVHTNHIGCHPSHPSSRVAPRQRHNAHVSPWWVSVGP